MYGQSPDGVDSPGTLHCQRSMSDQRVPVSGAETNRQRARSLDHFLRNQLNERDFHMEEFAVL